MAKFLDSSGLSQVWTKIGETFVSKGGGAVNGVIYPSSNSSIDLGTTSSKFHYLYVHRLVNVQSICNGSTYGVNQLVLPSKSGTIATTDDITNAVGSYLPLSGGTLTGPLFVNGSNDTPLVLKSGTANSGTYIQFKDSADNLLGHIGINGGNLEFHTSSVNTVLHTGNYSSYALPLSGGTMNVSSGTILGATYSGDILGYNPDYGTYIGGSSLGYYIYSGNQNHVPCISIGGTIRDIIHSGNYTSYCATAGHNHDGTYLSLSGGTITGNLTVATSGESALSVGSGTSGVYGAIYLYASGSKYTKITSLASGAYQEISIPNASGTFALTSDLSAYSLTSHNHDSSYLKLTGGTLSGNLNITAGSESALVLGTATSGEIGALYIYASGSKYHKIVSAATGQFPTITLPNASGTISLEGHTHSYLPLSGGTVSGNITANRFYVSEGGSAVISGRNGISGTGDDNDLWIYQPNSGRFVYMNSEYHHFYQYVKIGPDYTKSQPSYNLQVDGTLNATTIYQNGTPVSVNGHTHSYLPLSGGALTGNVSLATSGESSLALGNSNSGVYGALYLYASGSRYTKLVTAATGASHTITFPNADGTVSLEGHTHSYLPLSGGTVTGNLSIGNTTIYSTGSNGGLNSILVGDDTFFGDCNVGGHVGVRSNNTNDAGFVFFGSDSSNRGRLTANSSGILTWNDNTVLHTGNIGSQSVNHASSSGYIEPQSYTPTNNTVAGHKEGLVNWLNNDSSTGIGKHVIVGASIINQWDNDSATYYDSSVYAMIKIGGGYNYSTYGQWLLSGYSTNRLGVIGRNYNAWDSGGIRWVAYTSDIPTNNNQLTNGAGYITSSGSCNYANSAGSVAWGNITDKPSSYTPSSHTHDYVPRYSSVSNYDTWNDSDWGFSEWAGPTSSTGAPTYYGTSFNFRDATTWYFRLMFGTDNRIYYRNGINTTTLSAIGTIAYTSDFASASVNYATSAGSASSVPSLSNSEIDSIIV